jgi:uncharacterized protein (DUF2461 family)
MSRTSYFTADGLKFLRELRAHNEKPWFDANKERFEAKLGKIASAPVSTKRTTERKGKK